LFIDVFKKSSIIEGMRARRIVVVLAALLALAAGASAGTTRAVSFSTTSACVLLLSEKGQSDRKAIPQRIEPVADSRGLNPLPLSPFGAWAEVPVRFQRPPPVGR
jgi:hypothetical protein